jgi:hypothetical protein
MGVNLEEAARECGVTGAVLVRACLFKFFSLAEAERAAWLAEYFHHLSEIESRPTSGSIPPPVRIVDPGESERIAV